MLYKFELHTGGEYMDCTFDYDPGDGGNGPDQEPSYESIELTRAEWRGCDVTQLLEAVYTAAGTIAAKQLEDTALKLINKLYHEDV